MEEAKIAKKNLKQERAEFKHSLNQWANEQNQNAGKISEAQKIMMDAYDACARGDDDVILNLTNLGLTNLPDSVSTLFGKLKNIRLAGNKIPLEWWKKRIPDEKNLTSFISTLQREEFNHILVSWHNKDMTIMDQTKTINKFQEAFDACSRGEKSVCLDLSNLGLTSLPDCFEYLSQLKTLILNGNDIPKLPQSLKGSELIPDSSGLKWTKEAS